MFKIKAQIALMIYVLTSGFSVSGYVGAEQLNSLSENGKNTCGFSNMGLVPRGRARDLHRESKFCHASIVSRTKVLISNSQCWNKNYPNSHHKRLSCRGAKQLYELPLDSSSNQLTSGQTVVELPSPLPYTPHQLAEDQKERQSWISDDKDSCQVESPYETQPLADFETQISGPSSVKFAYSKDPQFLKHGAHIICQNTKGESFLLGQINSEGLLWPNLGQQWPDDFFDEPEVPFHQELDQIQQTRLLCQKNGECLESVGSRPLQLTEELMPIIERLNQTYQNKDLKRSHRELQSEFQELLLECQNLAWQIQRAEDNAPESSLVSGIVGSFEALSLNLAEKISDDFLVNQFMEIELISSELSLEEVQAVVQQVADRAEEQDMGTIQRVAQTALQLSREVVMKMLLEMNPDLTEEQQEKLWQELSRDLQSCLTQAKNTAMIEECSDKFALTAPTLIADQELERQLKLNFEQRNDEQGYKELKTRAQMAYRECLQNYYYPEQDNSLLGHGERIKACVYEGLISGYKFTAKAQIEESLLELTDDPKAIESIQLSALNRAQDCDYGTLFHRQERRVEQDYETLARLDVNDFQSALEDCSKGLTEVAGEQVITETVLNTPEVQENFGREQRIELSNRVLSDYYRPCMQSQENPDPQRCESMIKDLTTLQVAMPMMFKAVDEQMGQLNSDSSENLLQGDQIKDLVQTEMDACHDQLKEQHLEALNAGERVSESQVLSCLENGIRLVAKGSAKRVIEDGIRENPETREFADKILSRPQVDELPEQTAECFGQQVRALQNAEELGSTLPEISEYCALQTQKSATLLSLSPIINEKLSSNLPDDNERQTFIQDLLDGPEGFSEQIQSAQDQRELDAILKGLPAQVAVRFAQASVPGLVERYLEGMVSAEKRSDLSNQIVSNLRECLEARGSSQEDLDVCINQTTSLGHLLIIEEVVHYNALENLQDEQKAAQLVQDSQTRLRNCLKEIPESLDSDEFNRRLDPCISHEVGLISRDIPREAILSVSPLMRSEYSEEELREQMQKIESFYLSEGGLEGVDDRDPALSAYMSLNTCITSTRSDIKRTNAEIEEAQRMYERCTSQIKDTITGTVKRGFMAGGYEGQTRAHYDALDTAGDILLELTGESSPSHPESTNEDPHSEVLALLELVGQNTVIACNYDHHRCERELQKTQNEILHFKRENPDATSEELQERFIRSSFMELVIEANIAKSMKEELGAALSQFEDNQGLLKRQIERITSPATMGQVMSNRYGHAVKELVMRAIQEGEIESVVEDPRTRSVLGLALIENTEDNSFTDQLLFGLVQPQLNQQRQSSSGVGGLFNNTKVTFGRLFGVVKGRDFDWRRVRQTPQGRRAREVFAREVLLPVLQGEDLTRPAANNSQKSLQDIHLERIQGLIEEGIKNLSQ